MGCAGGAAGKIWRITGIKSFKGERGNFKLDASVDGQPVRFLQNGGTRISISFACNNACEGILSAPGTRNMFSRNAIQNSICKPSGDESSGNGTDG